ncbi:MAG: hypothetical protein AB7S26_23740 [Sandaracinaceae bacterium]
MSARISAGPIAILAALTISCAPSGDDPINHMEEWSPLSGEYTVRYLSPPWEFAGEMPNGVRFRVRSNAMIHGMTDAGPAKYDLTVTLETGTPSARIAGDVAEANANARDIVVPPREVMTRDGIVGMEMISFTSSAVFDRYRRVVYFPLGDARVLRYAFVATPDLGTPEVDAMVSLQVVRPAGP